MFYADAKQHLKLIRFTYKRLKAISHGTDQTLCWEIFYEPEK
jgi:hypothetical protein